MDTQTHNSESTDDQPRKVWIMPAFEVISKDVITGGGGSSAESNTAFS